MSYLFTKDSWLAMGQWFQITRRSKNIDCPGSLPMYSEFQIQMCLVLRFTTWQMQLMKAIIDGL